MRFKSNLKSKIVTSVLLLLIPIIFSSCENEISKSTHSITIVSEGALTGEAVTSDADAAAEGATVTLTAILTGDRKITLSSSAIDLNPAEISSNGETATFTMPASDTTISAVFSTTASAPSTPTPTDIFDGEWYWLSGGSTGNEAGVYGTKGVTVSTNYPGGRSNAAYCTDSNNNLWVFGGDGRDAAEQSGELNDLWKFDGTNWTWISGDSSIDSFGIYGSKGVASSDNVPGSRKGAVLWIDGDDNLWLFGGRGRAKDTIIASGRLNDLWKFDGTYWTWISGSDEINQDAVYGTMTVAAAANTPGGISSPFSWTDNDGNLMLFSGYGNAAEGNYGRLNDLWKFDGSNWTWVSGEGAPNASSSSDYPGGRSGGLTWKDSTGTIFIYGGYGYDADGVSGNLSGLWSFDGTDWSITSGLDLSNQAAVYGTIGSADSANTPGGRNSSAGWIDNENRLFLYGGITGSNRLADLWMFNGSNWVWVNGTSDLNLESVYTTPGEENHSNSLGNRSNFISWVDASGNFKLLGGIEKRNITTVWTNDVWMFKY